LAYLTYYSGKNYYRQNNNTIMSRVCDVCGKGPKKAANRSHARNKTLRRQNPNLQLSGGMRKCTRCMRTASKQAK